MTRIAKVTVASVQNPPAVVRVGPSLIAQSERFHLRSSIIGETYVIDIARPLAPAVPGRSRPVIYVLDGNTLFALTCQISRLLEIGSDAIPAAVVVGIGYPTDDSLEGHQRRRALRLRDFTPTADEAYWHRKFSGVAPLDLSLESHTGGASRFGAFIREELLPFVHSELQAETRDQTLVGMSLGGLFALHTFFTHPAMFTRWITVSPSIWWNGRALLDTEATIGSQTTHVSARLFISEGGAEEPETRLNILELLHRIRSERYPNLMLSHYEFPEETHQSIFPAAVGRGLRFVFKESDHS